MSEAVYLQTMSKNKYGKAGYHVALVFYDKHRKQTTLYAYNIFAYQVLFTDKI